MKKTDPLHSQLEMNFEGTHGNQFKTHLNNAEYTVLLEIRVPGRDSKLDAVIPKYAELEAMASAQTAFPCGLAFTDAIPEHPSLNISEFAAALCKTGRDRHLLYVNGRDRTEKDIRYELGLIQFEGFRNIAAVTGMQGLTLDETLKHTWFESACTLKINSELEKPLFAGCVSNPFKYTNTDCMTQTFKLTKQINAGASFVVMQAGWDMRKLLEARWRMFHRHQNIPSIARILFLTPEKAEDICADKCPGIVVSEDFKLAIRKEMKHSMAQFEAAQWRRFQIHAAGAKFLGYSGIQIAGIDRPETAVRLLTRLKEAMLEFPTFDDWRIAYNDYYSRIEMAPYPHRYYMFESMLGEGVTLENAKLTNEPLTVCTASEKFKFKMARLLLSHADRMPARDKQLTKKLLASCRGNCNHCTLPENLYICPGNCPKFMQNGPCGEAAPSGNCRLTGDECIHTKKLRRAILTNDYSSLEETIICDDSSETE